MTFTKIFISILIVAALHGAQDQIPQNEFPLRNGSVWVMAGDSITAQHLHSRYIEAYCFARFPHLIFSFRNAGIAGITTAKAIPCYDFDVSPWHPTVVSLEYGMNDACISMPKQCLADVAAYVDRIHADKAEPIWISPSPINSNDDAWAVRSRIMREYTQHMQAGKALNLRVVDQLTPMTTVWALNRPSEDRANLLAVAKAVLTRQSNLEGGMHLEGFMKEQESGSAPVGIATIWNGGAEATVGNLYQCALLVYRTQPQIAGRSHLRSFLDIWESKPKPASKDMLVDPIHPNPIGQLLMAASILKTLCAPALVSEAEIDGATGKAIHVDRCQVTDIFAAPGQLSFERLDAALPFPVAEEAQPALRLGSDVSDLSRYMVKIRNLLSGNYALRIDGHSVATVSSQDLARGWNMGLLDSGPISKQCRAILEQIARKDELVKTWRDASRKLQKSTDSETTVRLAQLTKQIEAADAAIRATAQPVRHRFSLALVAESHSGTR